MKYHVQPNLFSYLVVTMLLLSSIKAYSQNKSNQLHSFLIGDRVTYIAALQSELNASRQSAPNIHLSVSAKETLTGKISFQQSTATSQFLIGEIANMPGSSFHLEINDHLVTGYILLPAVHQAYKYLEDPQGRIVVQQVEENDIQCTGYPIAPEDQVTPHNSLQRSTTITFNSNPGAPAVLLLDFDGAYVPAGSSWDSGRSIIAAPSNLSDNEVREACEIVAEDFRIFNVNVTTEENVFNSVPRGRRLRCIITPTNYFRPNVGGAAFLNSFANNKYSAIEEPCFVFNPTGKSAGEAASHELGHCFTLHHDGLSNPATTYYQGHGNWAPIMGTGYTRAVVQWSKGEYANANNMEDDLLLITNELAREISPIRPSDHGNMANPTFLTRSLNSSFSSGIIDKVGPDFFIFNKGVGPVNINIIPASPASNLDIIARLYDGTREIGQYTTIGALNATINTTLAPGYYYLSVYGTGEGDPATNGYSNYASVGSYLINATIPAPIPFGRIVSLKGSNNNYVSSNVQNVYQQPNPGIMACDRASVGLWEQFTVVDAGNGQVALYNEGKYVSAEPTGRMVCNRDAIGEWEKFDWISNDDGTISLKANSNGYYVSSENGQADMTCNRPGIGSWESFAWGIVPGGRMANAISKEESEHNSIQLYPNPVTSNWVSYTLPVTVGQHTIIVRNMYGISVSEVQHTSAGDKNTLDTSTWKPGLYTVSIIGKSFRQTIQIEKQ